MSRPLDALQIIEVCYAGEHQVPPDHWCLDAYRESAYPRSGVPFRTARPTPPGALDDLPPDRALGEIGSAIAEQAAEGLRAGRGLLMTGGNCNHVTGILGGLQDAFGAGARIGLVWLDAHGDINTPQTSLSGSLGGMPVATCAGLAWPEWRVRSHIAAPLPIERIVLGDVRHLDVPEAELVRALGVPLARLQPSGAGEPFETAIARLSQQVDMIYLHIDADVLDIAYQPNHCTGEPDGPDMQQVLAAVETTMATGKVIAYAVVSVFLEGEGAEVSIASGCELIGEGLALWRRYGLPEVALS